MEEYCEPKRGVISVCPECGNQGKPVQKLTLESLLKDPGKIGDQAYWFCAARDCSLVYFSLDGILRFHKKDLKVRVGIKETKDPIPVCYCFGWDRKRILDEIARTGKTTAVESITKEVRDGNCFCERSNPEGTCCLGNVRAAVERKRFS